MYIIFYLKLQIKKILKYFWPWVVCEVWVDGWYVRYGWMGGREGWVGFEFVRVGVRDGWMGGRREKVRGKTKGFIKTKSLGWVLSSCGWVDGGMGG